jgi:hypothetical protein
MAVKNSNRTPRNRKRNEVKVVYTPVNEIANGNKSGVRGAAGRPGGRHLNRWDGLY